LGSAEVAETQTDAAGDSVALRIVQLDQPSICFHDLFHDFLFNGFAAPVGTDVSLR
jgi:hypothetical protein